MNDRLSLPHHPPFYSFTLQNLLFQASKIIFDPSISKQNIRKYNKLDERLISILAFIETHITDTELSLNLVSKKFHTTTS